MGAAARYLNLLGLYSGSLIAASNALARCGNPPGFKPQACRTGRTKKLRSRGVFWWDTCECATLRFMIQAVMYKKIIKLEREVQKMKLEAYRVLPKAHRPAAQYSQKAIELAARRARSDIWRRSYAKKIKGIFRANFQRSTMRGVRFCSCLPK